MNVRPPPSAVLATPIALIAVTAAPAGAQNLGGGTIEIAPELSDGEGGYERVNEQDLREFFNDAECSCGSSFSLELRLVGAQGDVPSDPLQVWTGEDCDMFDNTRLDRCEKITTIQDVGTLRSPENIPIPLLDFVAPNDPGPQCPTGESQGWVWLFQDTDDQGQEVLVNQWQFVYDTQPPNPVLVDVAPGESAAKPGESAAVLEWELPEARQDDYHAFQVLCARAPGQSGGDDGFPTEPPQYLTSWGRCGIDDGVYPLPPGSGGGGGVDAGPGTPAIDGGASLLAPDAGATAPDAGAAGPEVDAGPGGSSCPGGLEPQLCNLDPSTICATAEGGTQRSIRVEGLENGIKYQVVLLAIDEAGNANPIDFGEVTPREAVDFWEDYKDRGGAAQGGYCFVATASYGGYDSTNVRVLRDFRDGTLARFGLGRSLIDWYYETGPAVAAVIDDSPILRAVSAVALAPVVVAAAVWEYTTIAGKIGLALALALAVWLRRRRLAAGGGGRGKRSRLRWAVAVAAAVVAVAVFGGSASAQTYWQEVNEPVAPAGPPAVTWNLGLELGPYAPNVDEEFSGETGPFETMFGGGPFLMSKIELDRYFLYPGGQLGATASLGYLSTSAASFDTDDDGNIRRDMDGDPIRSAGDTTTFRLLPTSLGAAYRYTQLDDALGVPIVPYAKLALAYYLWWATQPDGSVSEANGESARGGSFGWQGTVGLALRAERLDEGAAQNLRNEFGIEHAGFFAEATYAQVDGFGREENLSVGDLAFFGGINFEF